MGQRYCTLEDQKPWPVSGLNQVFAIGRGLQPKVKCANWETYWAKECKLSVSQMGVWKRSPQLSEAEGCGGEVPSRMAIFCNFSGKLAILLPLDHNSHVFRAI